MRLRSVFVAALCVGMLCWSTGEHAYICLLGSFAQMCTAVSLVSWVLTSFVERCLHRLHSERSVAMSDGMFPTVGKATKRGGEATRMAGEVTRRHDDHAKKYNVFIDGVEVLRLRCAALALRSYILLRRWRARTIHLPGNNARRDCVVINYERGTMAW